MSEHQSLDAQTVVVVQAPGSGQQQLQQPASAGPQGWWSPQVDGRHRWWNGENWTDCYTDYPNDPAAIQKAMLALAANPPRWIVQDDGRERWWAGLSWTDDYKVEPEPVVAVAVGAIAPAVPTAAEEIKQLADLHSAGVLTDEEFAAAKKKLLGI